jgi:hypothetical protein|nr:MAG TPA: hypothetical protein [Caudoviricetes sp.]
MEEKEIVRKSVLIPNKWLKELLDFLGIEEDRYLAWMLFPHVKNKKLGFIFSEDRIKEIIRNIYHPTEEELKQEDKWEKELIEEAGYSKMDFWKEAMMMYPLHQFAYWKNALDPLKLGKMMANLHKISKELNKPLDSPEVLTEYQKHFEGIEDNVTIAFYQPIYFPVDSIYGSTDPIILPDNFEVTKEEKKEEEKDE